MGYYKAPIEAGKIYACKQCGKVPIVGQERFYEKKADGTWMGCIDFECFKKQGGSTEAAAKGGGKFTSSKFKLEQVQVIAQITEGLIAGFYKQRTQQGNQLKIPLEAEAIMFESLFRTVAGNFKA